MSSATASFPHSSLSYEREFLSQSMEHRLPGARLAEIGEHLNNELQIDSWVNAGWAYLQAGFQDRKADHFIASTAVGKRIEQYGEGTYLQAMGRQLRITRCLYELASVGRFPHDQALYQTIMRLKRLNALAPRLYEIDPNPRITGLATEAAVAFILTRYAQDHPDDKRTAWFTFPWQRTGWGPRQDDKDRYDIVFGSHPLDGQKIQVLSSIKQQDALQVVGTDDGDELMNYWREKYNPDIKLIFGDVHLGNSSVNRFYINELIGGPRAKTQKGGLRRLAQNLLDEVV